MKCPSPALFAWFIIGFFFAALVPPHNAEGATVSVDSVGPNSTGAFTSSGSSLSWTHTVSGSNTLLTVGVAVGTEPDSRTVSVTYNGVALTSTGKVHSNNSASGFVELFYLKAPATGAHTVQVTLSGGFAAIESGSVSFTGVNQTTPVRNITTNYGSGTVPVVAVSSATGNMVVSALANGASISSSGNTARWIRNGNSSTAGGNGAQSTAAGASSVNMTYSVSNDLWSVIAMDVVADAGPSAPTISSFVASPASISQGSSSTVSWSASGNPTPTLSIDNGIGAVTGNSIVVSPTTTTTYSLTATNTIGSAFRSTTVTVTGSTSDNTAPTVGITAPLSGVVVSGTAAVSATASDNVGVAGVQFVLDGTNLGAEDTTSPYSITWNTTTAANGAHTLSARARDAAGNTATSTVNISVDNQPPTGSVIINGGASATNSRNSVLTLSATDALGAVTQMRFSNTGTSYSIAEAYNPTRAWTLSFGTGTKTVYVQFQDVAGNWSAAFTDTIVYETTPPTISAVSASNITNVSATITWTTNEPASSQVDYGLTTAYGTTTALDASLATSHSVTVTGLASSRTYNYRVRSRDAAGNEQVGFNNTFTTLSAPPDSTPPSIPGDPVVSTVSASRINLSWTASTDNVAVTGYKVFRDDVQIATTGVAAYSNTGLVPSTTYSYAVSAYDAAGNESARSGTLNTATWPDTTPPTVSLSAPADGSTISGTATVASSVVDDVAVAGVRFQIDAVDISTEDTTSPYAVSLDTTFYSDGAHVLTAIARDSSNNITISAPVTVTVDNTSPPPLSKPTMVQHVQTDTNQTNEVGNGFRINLPNPALANNCLIIALTYQYSAGRTIAITDNIGSNTYIAGPTTNNGTIATKIYYALGVAARTQNFTVTFDHAIVNFQANISEFYNVATINAFDGGAGASTATSPAVSTGSLTPSSDGDLVYQYMVDVSANVLGFNHTVSSVTAGTGFTLLSSGTYGIAAQYQIQTSHAALNPTINVSQSGGQDPFNTVAIALRAATAGTAPGAGIRVVHVTHVHTETSSQNISVPSSGNLMVVATTYPTVQGYTINSVTDNKGNGYTKLSPDQWSGQILYTPSAATTSATMIMTIAATVGMPYVIYDVTGAATAPFDKYAVAIRPQTGPQSDITDAPIITPSTAHGLVLTAFPVGTGPVSGSIGAGYMFDSVVYTGQTDCSGCMNSADGYSHIYNTDTAPLHFGWHVTNDGTVTDGGALAVAFKGAGF